MGDKNDGGPAFPLETTASGVFFESGMSLRDYFAAAYLNGLISQRNGGSNLTPDERARLAYIHADAMLVERDK